MRMEEVMQQLEEMGTSQNVKIYTRHGASEPMFGVSFANLRTLQKKIKRDHALAVELWNTGNLDARMLATMIAEPGKLDRADAEARARQVSYHHLVDQLCSNVLGPAPYARDLAEQWIDSDDEWLGRFGWNLAGELADRDPDLPDEYFLRLVEATEDRIHEAKNRTREAMNTTLIRIGIRNSRLQEAATRAGERIGPVDVDQGDTSCKTPYAPDYIAKTMKRREEQARKRAEKARAKKTGAKAQATRCLSPIVPE
ncbi:DNA alkylation repair protein [bacterium]|nr:DNA alkylation repair protein [bacterium]